MTDVSFTPEFWHAGVDTEVLRHLLLTDDTALVDRLRSAAREVAVARFGRRVFVRGLVEISNVCRNDCFYCGIRRSNTRVERYTLSADQVLAACARGYELGFRTFVLQGGEWGAERDKWIADTVARIRNRYPDCAITLSLGEHSREAYAAFRQAGADRYLLRHETRNPDHYRSLHPDSLSLDHRLQCLCWLKELGYQVGTGMMVGSPGQTVDHLVEDLLFLRDFRPHMVGIGPFVPHHDTPLAGSPAGSVDLTTRIYAIVRLMLPDALIPSTTALATISPNGRLQGLLAGANVVMPNLSPTDRRDQYALYDGKANSGAEAAEGIAALKAELDTIGYTIDWSRGDYQSSKL